MTFDFEPHIVWTPAARRKLLPRPGTGAKPMNVDGDAAWKYLRKVFKLVEKPIHEALESKLRGEGDIAVDLEGTRKALARLESTRMPRPDDLITEACLHAVLTYTCWANYQKNVPSSIVRYWIAGGGISFAIEALADVNARHWFPSGRSKLAARVLTPAELVINQEHVDEDAWRVVRQFLAGAEDATYAEALATAKKLWPKALVGTRCGLALGFPNEETLAREALATCIAYTKKTSDTPICVTFLSATCRDREFIETVVAQAGMWDREAEVIDSLGPSAFPLVRDAFHDTQNQMRPAAAQKKVFAQLSLIQSQEAATFVASLVDNVRLRQSIMAYFDRAPHLAVVALANSIAKEPKKKSPAIDVLKALVGRHTEATAAAYAKSTKPARAVIDAMTHEARR